MAREPVKEFIMYVKRPAGPAYVTLPSGQKFTRSDLPPRTTKRWVASRKARVVLAVQSDLISKDEACTLYDLSKEEFDGWVTAIKSHGIGGLKTTKLQNYRQL